MISRKISTTKLIVVLLLMALSTSLTAATVTFTGGGDGTNWEDPDNWDTGTVPTAADDVIITNANSVMISTEVGANSLRIDMTAQLTLTASGILSLNNVTNNGNMIQLNDSATLTNDGEISADMAQNSAIDLNNNSRVFNNGTMNLTNPGLDPINLTNTSEFTNNGTINGSNGEDAIELGNSTKFYNHGDIYMVDFSDEGVDLDNSTSFENTGFLSLTDVANDAICIDGTDDHFMNSGMIQLIDPGNNYIELDNGLFTNQAGGIINMSEGTDDGIQLESGGDFDNYGEININIGATSSADDGIEVQGNATFTNFSIINITLAGDANANTIFLDASSSNFFNEPCGLVNLLSNHRIEVDPGAILTNNGVLFSVYNGTHDNQGTITNNGIINAPNGFMVSPNAVAGTPGTMQDMEVPTITCPTDIMVTTDCFDDLETIIFTEPEGMDNCTVYAVVCDPPSGSDFGVGTTTVTCTVSDQAGNTNACTFNVTVNQPTIDPPVASVTDKAFCQNADLSPSLTNTGVSVGNTLAADEKVVWVLTSAPAGSAYTAGDEFTTVSCGSGFANFGELAVANTSRTIRVQEPGTAPVGTYTFDAYVYNCTNGCTSSSIGPFSIEVIAAPTVEISADPDGDLCLGQMDVQYDASIMASDGGTYSYLWCAYNSGDGSGTCFNGFDDNTSSMPSRDWTSSAGPKSVGVTVMSEVPGCEAEGLYSFNVVAPTMVECPMDMMGTLITDDMTFECAATFNWDHPEVMPGPCDPVTLTITISGGSVAVGPDAVTPGTPYSFTFEELGIFTVTYDLVDAVGNMSSCSFTITVDGLPCGWVDNGGIGCADNLNSSSYDQGTETFTLTANNCALTGWPYSSDQLAFVFTELCGDGEIVAQVTSIDATGFAGVMMRDSEAPDAPMMAMGTNTINKVLKQVRILPGYPAFPQFVLSYDQFWVRIVRQGNQFMGFASTDGVSWVMYLNQQVFVSNNCLRVGMFTYSEKPGNPITATFDNVSVEEYGGMMMQGINQSVAQGEFNRNIPSVDVYPNPTNGIVTIELSATTFEGASQLQVFNSVGQLITQQQMDASNGFRQQVDLTGLVSGMYYFKVLHADGTLDVQKVIVE